MPNGYVCTYLYYQYFRICGSTLTVEMIIYHYDDLLVSREVAGVETLFIYLQQLPVAVALADITFNLWID